jgi:transmembrane sensor
LVFEGTPLSEVVRQVNRYRSGDIVLTNSAIGHRPVNAVLHTGQIDNAVSQIQQLLNLEVRRLPGGVILMS